MKRLYLFISIILFLIPCYAQSQSEKIHESITVSNIQVDSLLLEIPDNYLIINGFLRQIGNKIYFFDPNNFHVLVYDLNGKLLEIKLEEGEGPKEVMGFQFHGFNYLKNEHKFFDFSYHFYEFDLPFENREKAKFFDWPMRKAKYEEVKPDDINIYDFNYGNSSVDSRWLSVTNDNKMILPLNVIWRVSPKFNTQDHPEEFFEKGYFLGFYNLNTNQLEKGFGKYPKRYQEDKYLTSLSYSYTSLMDNRIYVSFNADPRIHIYDLDGNFMSEFGQKYDGLKDEYPLTKTRQEYYDKVKTIKEKFGFYGHIKAFEENGLVFRSVVLQGGISGKSKTGLQIYQNQELIWEGKVPNKFNVIGKHSDWYYADGIIDEERERLAIYKFKIIEK